ncbi:MAG: hypothetical protein QOE27_2041 [Solirubrobacteraceae bacterium]|jgi:hypothetical protein|nr:hypothetical protein [Solirubrobacteraceae bacterium]MEA2354442.1 hypothetical protein [Solirubrobacteraceae bacterium]
MTVTDQMITRGAHYTGLLAAMDSRGATKLRRDERELLLEAADELLFDEPDGDVALDRALELIAGLEESDRWSPVGAAELRRHIRGCGFDGPTRG